MAMRRLVPCILSLLATLRLAAQSHHLAPQTPQELQELLSHTAEPLPLVSAHRGGGEQKGFPENCIATFEQTLRHTFAMRLLSRGVGMKAIGDVLGHHSFYGTSAYLRLDVAMLRGVALPVPSSVGDCHA